MVVNYNGPGTYLLIDVKMFDGSGATHVAHDHIDRVRLGPYVAEARCRSDGAGARTTVSRRPLPSHGG